MFLGPSAEASEISLSQNTMCKNSCIHCSFMFYFWYYFSFFSANGMLQIVLLLNASRTDTENKNWGIKPPSL